MSPVEQIRSLLARDPFLPFAVRTRSGQELRIGLPDELRLPTGGNWLWFVNDLAPKRVPFSEVVEARLLAEPKIIAGPMTIEKFDEFLKRRPFEPFTIHVADGSHVTVIGPEFASRTQQGRTIFVSTGGERTECIDLLMVTRLATGIDNPQASKAAAE